MVSNLTVSVFDTEAGKRAILSHVLTEVRIRKVVPEYISINIKQQIDVLISVIGDMPIYGVDDGSGNVAICTFTPLLLDPHCLGLGINVSYFIAASSNPNVASHLMRLVVRTAKAQGANWIVISKRVGVNKHTSRVHYLGDN